MTFTIGYIVGSLSDKSINRRLASALKTRASESFDFQEIRLDPLPLYNRDHDHNFPAEATELKKSILSADGLLFVTPEYNRSIPAIVKNGLEWASRPYGDNALAGIPAGVIGASPGGPGTAMAQQHLRNILAYLDVPTMGQPEAFIQYTQARFDDDGSVRDENTDAFLRRWLSSFEEWVRRHSL